MIPVWAVALVAAAMAPWLVRAVEMVVLARQRKRTLDVLRDAGVVLRDAGVTVEPERRP